MSSLSELSGAIAATVAQAAERVVAVSGPGMSPVSGLVWRTGLVVAAEEVLDGGEGLKVTMRDGGERDAELVGRDPSTDVALLRLDTGDFGEWVAAPDPQVGSIALVVGRGEHSPIAGQGLVAETGPAWQSMNGGRIDARIRLGLALSGRAEGAAAVTPECTLIGMAVTGPRRRTIVIPASTIARAVDNLSSRGYVARGYLGISVQPLGRRAEQKGAVVTAVEPESPAGKAGIAVGDIVTNWDGEELEGIGDLAQRLGTDSVGRTIRVGVTRGGAASEYEVTIGERRLSR